MHDYPNIVLFFRRFFSLQYLYNIGGGPSQGMSLSWCVGMYVMGRCVRVNSNHYH